MFVGPVAFRGRLSRVTDRRAAICVRRYACVFGVAVDRVAGLSLALGVMVSHGGWESNIVLHLSPRTFSVRELNQYV